MSKIISQSETTASRYDAGASSMEWRPLIAIDANVQMQNPKDEAMFDETTMVDDDEVMAKSKATVQPKPSWFDDDDYTVQSLNGGMALQYPNVFLMDVHVEEAFMSRSAL
ncbi:hypothetical protein ACFX19_044086 [Malus domestica]